jgi:uncharacterized membrane protein
MFGTLQVGAIHGRLLLAWSLAAVFGPTLINYLRAYQIETVGLPASQAYSFTMYIMAGLLLIGFLCNIMVKPVAEKYHYKYQHTADKSKEPQVAGAKVGVNLN